MQKHIKENAENAIEKRFLEQLKTKQSRFVGKEIADKTGYKDGTISDYLNQKKPISPKFIRKVCEKLELNSIYVFEGKMDNFPEDNVNDTLKSHEIKSGEDPEKRTKRIPILGDGLAGTSEEMNMEPINYTDDYIDVGDLLKDSESAFVVYGNSMTPNYPSGCILGLKRNYDNFIQPGEIYLIESFSNRVFKRLYWNDDKTGYLCVSDNIMIEDGGPRKGRLSYPAFEIHLKDVVRLFDVTGMIKRMRNSGLMNRK